MSRVNKPRICLLTETYHPLVGGGERQARTLAEGLMQQGWQVLVVTRRHDATLPDRESIGGVAVYRVPPSGSAHWKKWGLLLSCVPSLWQLRRQYDLIFVSGFRIVGITAVLLAKPLGKRVILKADSQGEMSGAFFTAGLARIHLSPDRFPFSLFLRGRNWILRWANAFVAITPDIATELIDAGIRASAIHRIPNGVDTNCFFPVDERQKRALRHKLGLPPQGKFIIYTGRLVSYKGLPLLLKVWKDLRRKYGRIYLLLVGTGGLDMHNCEAELKAYVEANGLSTSVFFTGSAQNVEDYVQASDIFVLPTENDAFPSSLVEGMACGLTAVATPIGAIDTIITHQQNGLLVQPGDFEQLHSALDLLLTDNTLATRLAQAGWQTVQDHYSAATVTQHYARLFRQTVAPM